MKNPHIFLLGLNCFPCGYAETQKMRLVSKGLVEAGCRVTVVNRLWMLGHCPANFKPDVRGEYESVEYIFSSGTPHRPANFVRRNIRRIISTVREFKIITRFAKTGEITCAILSAGSFWQVVIYRIISLIFSFPVVVSIAELRSAILVRKNLWNRLDASLFDKRVFYFVDGVIPISELLIGNLKRMSPLKPFLKVPALVDRSRYDGMVRNPDRKYLLFCGSLAYFEVIQFILRTFDRSHTENDIFLYLVVNGPQHLFKQLEDFISRSTKGERVKLYSKLTDEELSLLYFNAYALLIPLRPTLQDSARFPHKIGEYCASGRPVITTDAGEIRSYFRHRETAFIAKEYSEASYAGVIEEAVSDPQLADRIGANGKILAEREFDYIIYGEKIKEFITSVSKAREIENRL